VNGNGWKPFLELRIHGEAILFLFYYKLKGIVNTK